MHIDTLLKARWIIPVEPERIVLNDHALAIHGGRIVDILPIAEAEAKYQAASQESFDRHALIPGFVNAHTHAAMSLLRGVADDRPLMEWLVDHIWPLEQKWVGEAFVRDGTDLAMAEMIRGGVTCFNDMYFFPEVTARQVARCGMRAVVGMILIDFPSAWASGPEEYLSKGLALHDELRHNPLVSVAFAPHAPYSVSDEPLLKVRTLAAELDRPIHMHLHETRDEIDQSRQRYGMRPMKWLQQLDFLGPSFVAVHMTQLEDDEIARFAESGGSVVHCPESNLKLASGFCPVAKLIKAGINVAIGTDGAASNNDLDLMGEMRSAALLSKAVANDAAAVPAHTALRMATLNGARALGLESDIGSLEVGKYADITAIRLDELETQPLYDPISNVVYAAGRHQVTDVWVGGRRLLKNRELITLDIDEILQKAAAWREKTLASEQQPS
ncbi:TRZ/ATZ family hydrolase [Methylocaldum szegediense]|uniref:5-methylthioadenosine/S-adenosylhomocysteine deaminase n=1 Tax=Methylocaldum szegediense TaxID=73780 RepID=A0ABM9I9C1_9GAMM|nr:TRZ/ATZ family hydrolase [Methylocaldum szegediense]CAI8972653.1 5-methylthioadenosine/S-adenosylhomocysteine deaminase [Methylocaldum szegediense]